MCSASVRESYFTLKLTALLAPAVVVTLTLSVPKAAVVGTLHLICVALQETYVVHVFPPNCTELVPCAAPKSAPLMVTSAPRLPEAGSSFVILGAAGDSVTVKLVALVAVPPGVVTATLPLVAAAGTVAVILSLIHISEPTRPY